MNRPDELMGPEESHVRDALRAAAAPAPDAAFRERLGRAFAAGAIAPGRCSDFAAADEAGPAGDARASVVRGPWGRARRLTLAVAAAAAVVTVVAGLNLGDDWHVVAADGEGIVVVNDRATPMLHAEELAKRIRRGGRLRVQEGSLVVMAGDDLMIEITPGTDLTLPPAPNHWWSRAVRGRIESGECRITTGPGFRGASLAIATPEAAVEVRGTTLAVIREPGGTCVCVLEGSVMVGRAGGLVAPVESGRLRFVYAEDRAPKEAAIRPVENEQLRRFRDRRVAEARR